MKWFENFVAGKSVVLEDARDVGMHELVVTNSILDKRLEVTFNKT
jgi:hypothetical protein